MKNLLLLVSLIGLGLIVLGVNVLSDPSLLVPIVATVLIGMGGLILLSSLALYNVAKVMSKGGSKGAIFNANSRFFR